MPKINVTLVVARDEETGDLGLVVKGMKPNGNTVNSATEGRLVAHDLIEHVNGVREIGSITDEMEALGAIWYVRGQHNDITRTPANSFYTPHEHIASDVVRMFRDYLYGEYVDTSWKPTRACEADVDLEEIVLIAERDKNDEFEPKEMQEVRDKWPAYAEVCLYRMRIGYRKARRRWEKYGRLAANHAFWEIARAIDKGASLEVEGMQFKLTYDNHQAMCWEHYPD